MKHVKLFFALFAMLALGTGTAWGEEELVYTLTPASTGGNAAPHNSYADGVDFTCDEIIWNITGNSSMVPWRIGGKSLNNTERTLYSKTAMQHKVTKVEVSHGTASSITVNSFKLIVASDANFSNVISTVDGTFEASSTATLACPNGADWSNAYYKFVYNVTVSSTSNKYLQFTEAKFYGEASTTPDPTPDPEEPDPTPGTGSSTGWVETAIDNITSSDIVVVTMTNSSSATYAMSNDNGTGTAPTAVSVTVNGDKLAAEPADNLKWNITNSSGELTIYPNGDNAKWLYCTNSNNGVRVGTNANKTFTIEGAYLKHTETSRYVGVYNSQDWRCYTNTTGNTAGQTLKFYKYVEPTSGGEGEEPTIAAPTFSIEAGKYTEAKEVTLSAEEGTIYYTLDGTTPDAESTEYIEPIVLDECGTTTIKAIAISGENSSPVTSATYTIKLPLNNSQANPYTEADAIEVYDGGCYDNQDVYVKGVVTSASYNSTYGNYTITLKGGFQFYRFQETAENKFTEDYIVAGDTLVACGKLDNYKGTYQLAEGCYLVERKPYSAPKVDISNTEETAYTVEKAIELIDDITSDLTKLVYVKGTVSEIVTEYDAEYGNITYNISSDGSTSSPQFQLYRGKSYNGDKFTSADDVKVGDKVVVYGEMTKYGSTYEMLANNQLVALEREGTTTGVDNVETTVAAKKAIINGQLVIVKDGVKFNALGQVIK